MKSASIVIASALMVPSLVPAQNLPQPPCAGPANPAYAKGGQQPSLQVWDRAALALWNPPQCAGIGASDLVIALAGTFNHTGSAEALLARFGAISTLGAARYWSSREGALRPLVTEAAALAGPDPKARRGDFSVADLKAGRELFFAARHGKGSSSESVYRLRVSESGNDRIALELENASPVRAAILTLFNPGDLKFRYFLQRGAGGTWSVYALLAANSLIARHNETSVVNRAVAMYRFFTGVPNDSAPPPARLRSTDPGNAGRTG